MFDDDSNPDKPGQPPIVPPGQPAPAGPLKPANPPPPVPAYDEPYYL